MLPVLLGWPLLLLPVLAAHDLALSRLVPVLVAIAAFCVGGVQLCAVSKLPREEILGDLTHSSLDEITVEAQCPPVPIHAPQRHVDMRMFCIVVRRRDPVQQAAAELPLDPAHQLASEPFQINLLSEFRRNDELPHPLIPGTLPAVEPLRNGDGFGAVVEAAGPVSVTPCGGLPRDIAAVGAPLSPRRIPRVHYAHGAPLIERTTRPRPAAGHTAARLRLPCHSGVFHDGFV